MSQSEDDDIDATSDVVDTDGNVDNSSRSSRPVRIRRELFAQKTTGSSSVKKRSGGGAGELTFTPNINASTLVRAESNKPFYKHESVESHAAPVLDAATLLSESLKEKMGGSKIATGPSRILGGAMDGDNVVKGRGRGRGRGATMDNRAFQEHTRLLQRRRKQLSTGTADQGGGFLSEVSFNETDAYLPLSLPFLHKETDADGDAGAVSKKKVPSTVYVDEANRNAAEILFGGDPVSALTDKNMDDQWFILQTPDSLPPLAGSKKNVTLKNLQHGHIGELVIRKSGRIDLQLNSEKDGTQPVFEINVGSESSFHQQVISLNMVEGEFCYLGDLQKKIVATPNIVSNIKM